MLSYVYAAALHGIEATLVKVEVDVQSSGLPSWNMVGLLETAVKEARDRVGSAIRNAGFVLPNRKTIINFSPADLKKSGAHYDLSLAIGLLTAVGVCRPLTSRKFLVTGELSLTGEVLPVNGVLLMAKAAEEHKLDGIIVPQANAWEARLTSKIQVIPAGKLMQVVDFLNNGTVPDIIQIKKDAALQLETTNFSDVHGQPFAKRGLEIAAAGEHNVALRGPPGTGKTMLAERLPTILPPLTREESLSVAKILSWHGFLKETSDVPKARPFRAPHHTASYAGLIGGCAKGLPRLGEISLAHNGVLFLDELSEFKSDVIQVLRQPMESGEIKIVRAGVNVNYPARFMLVAAFNPCKCGYHGHPTKTCTCSVPDIRRYQTKLSGPLLDRIDLHIEVGPPPHEALIESNSEEGSDQIRSRIIEARKRQEFRFGKEGVCNAKLSGRELEKYCVLSKEERFFLKKAATSAALSARSFHRVIKVARTIADLAGSEKIKTEHIAEAFQFRMRADEF